MKSLLKPVFAAGLVLAAASPILAAPAAAQAIKGIGVADLNAAVVNSSAYKTSEQQRPVTYKAQLDQANARAAQIKAQLDPLVKKFETDRKAANPDQKSLEQQENTINQIYQQGQQEVNTILQPVALSRAYVAEQITDILPKAVENAAKKKGVTLVLAPDELRYADPSYSIDDAVTAELNAQLPSAQLVPPAGWQPRQVREQQAAQGQGAQPSGPQTEGR